MGVTPGDLRKIGPRTFPNRVSMDAATTIVGYRQKQFLHERITVRRGCHAELSVNLRDLNNIIE
jgi:hypothetical protein